MKEFEYFTLKNEDGTYKTLDDLCDDVAELVYDALDTLCEGDQLDIGNRWRDDNNYDILHRLDEYEVNEVLCNCEPWEILNMEIDKWDDYFIYDGWDFKTTDDVWYDIDLERLADAIVNGSFDSEYREIEDILEEYAEAKEELENLNEYRESAREVLVKFTNCEADWKDLYAVLEKIVNTDDAWAE